MRPTHYVFRFSMMVLMTGFLCAGTAFPADTPTTAGPTPCPAVNYQDGTCECPSDKDGQACPCDTCTGDDQCECIKTVKASSGTLQGSIKVVGTKVKTEGSKSDKDVIVYLEPVEKTDYPAPVRHSVVDQKGLTFIPHVKAVQKGTTVDFLNNDNVDHNIFCVDDCCKILEEKPGAKPKFMDLGSWGQGEKRAYTFAIPGEAVLLCKLHPEMAAYVMVLDTPFFTVVQIDKETQTAGYTLNNIPRGKYQLKAWNKKCSSDAQEVTITAGSTIKQDIDIARKRRRR